MYSHFSLKSNIQSFLQLCAGGLFVLVEEISGVVAGVIDLPQSLEAAA